MKDGNDNEGAEQGNRAYEDRDNSYDDREEIWAKSVRAGKRTYFFDVRATRGNDYYLTITESKRKYADDGSFRYQKHKIFLYKEDFKKFSDALAETVIEIVKLRNEQGADLAAHITDSFADVDFGELDAASNHEEQKEHED